MNFSWKTILLFIGIVILLALTIYFATRKKDCPANIPITIKPKISFNVSDAYANILEAKYNEEVYRYKDVPPNTALPSALDYIPLDNIIITTPITGNTITLTDSNTPATFNFNRGDQVLISIPPTTEGGTDGYFETFLVTDFTTTGTSTNTINVAFVLNNYVGDPWSGPAFSISRPGYIALYTSDTFEYLYFEQQGIQQENVNTLEEFRDYMIAHIASPPTPPYPDTLSTHHFNLLKRFGILTIGQISIGSATKTDIFTTTITDIMTTKITNWYNSINVEGVSGLTDIQKQQRRVLTSNISSYMDRKNNRNKEIGADLQLSQYSKSQLRSLIKDGQAGGNAGNTLENILGDDGVNEQSVAWLESIYPGIEGNFTDADWERFFLQTGLLGMDVALACGGLGFLIGPLNSIVSEIFSPKSPPAPSLEEVLKSVIDSALANNNLTTMVNNQNAALNGVNIFWKDYNLLKNNRGSYCLGGCRFTNGTDQQCDPIQMNNDAVECMRRPIAASPSIEYDPSMILANPQGDGGQTKRNVLFNSLTNTSSPAYTLLKGSTANGGGLVSMIYGPADITKNPYFNVGPGAHISFVGPYQIILSYLISYYQELSTLDQATVSTGYYNPWISSAIGQPQMIWNTNTNAPQLTYSAQPQGTLLGDIQFYAKQFEYFLRDAAKTYFIGINTADQDDCCEWWKPCKCRRSYAFQIWDNISADLIPDSWYAQIRTQFPNFNTYYRNNRTNWDNSNPMNKVYALNSFFQTYHTFLGNPCDVLISLMKFAGYTPNIEGYQLWNNYVYAEFTRRGMTAPPGVPNIPLQWNLDPSGGYPFGIQSPSYLDACRKYYNIGGFGTPPANPTPIFGSDIQDTYQFNSFCTPMVNLTPNEEFDFKMFNIPGDNNGSYGVGSCTDPKTIGAISCQNALVSAGNVTNGANANSRSAFCVNSDGDVSVITSASTPSSGAGTNTYGYTGDEVQLIVPSGVSIAKFEMWGAGGGAGGGFVNGQTQITAPGGGGGYCVGQFTVSPGDLLTISVGQGGISTGKGQIAFGGGGGGTSANSYMNGIPAVTAGGGGGSTSIVLNNTDEIASVGGGGGGNIAWIRSTNTVIVYPGGGDSQSGQLGLSTNQPSTDAGQGGTSAGPGRGAGTSTYIGNLGQNGSLYNGGSGANNAYNSCGAGGGGGYYGGGSGGTQSGDGGASGFGGSSGGGGWTFASPLVTATTQGVAIIQNANGQISAGHSSTNYPTTIVVGDGGTGFTNNVLNNGNNGFLWLNLS